MTRHQPRVCTLKRNSVKCSQQNRLANLSKQYGNNCILIFTNKKKTNTVALFNSTAKDPCFPSTLKVVHFIFLDQVMYSNNNYYQGSFIRYPLTVPLSTWSLAIELLNSLFLHFFEVYPHHPIIIITINLYNNNNNNNNYY